MFYAAFLHIVDHNKNTEQRQVHLAYVDRLYQEGKIINAGPFSDGLGGLILYQTQSLEEAQRLAEQDPVVSAGACKLQMREWNPFQFPIGL